MKKLLLIAAFVLFSASVLSSCEKGVAISPAQQLAIESILVKPISAAEISELAKKSGAKLTLVNLWASWCAPCRHEFPDLLKFRTAFKNRNVDFQFISVDFEGDLNDAKTFLAEQKVDFLTYIKSGDDNSFIQKLDKKWSGALPSTFVYDHDGVLLFRFDGPVTFSVLETRVLELLNRENAKGKKI